jgi:hypothetical protein
VNLFQDSSCHFLCQSQRPDVPTWSEASSQTVGQGK